MAHSRCSAFLSSTSCLARTAHPFRHKIALPSPHFGLFNFTLSPLNPFSNIPTPQYITHYLSYETMPAHQTTVTHTLNISLSGPGPEQRSFSITSLASRDKFGFFQEGLVKAMTFGGIQRRGATVYGTCTIMPRALTCYT